MTCLFQQQRIYSHISYGYNAVNVDYRTLYCKQPVKFKYLVPQTVSGKDYMSALRLPRKVSNPQLLAKTLILAYFLMNYIFSFRILCKYVVNPLSSKLVVHSKMIPNLINIKNLKINKALVFF